MLSCAPGITLNHVPYKGSGPLVQDLLAARVDLAFDSPITSGPHVALGRLRALAVTSVNHNRNLPGVPTVFELGYAGMELDFWFGLFAPAERRPPWCSALHQEFVTAIRTARTISKKIPRHRARCHDQPQRRGIRRAGGGGRALHDGWRSAQAVRMNRDQVKGVAKLSRRQGSGTGGQPD